RLMEKWISLIFVLSDIIGMHPQEIVPGWVFSTKVRALYVRKNGVVYLLLNPLKDDGSNYWRLSGDELYSLVATCIHELTHAQGYDWHDEGYANALTTNMAKVMAEMTRVRKVMRG